MTDSAQPVAGWYPDPENATAERWWDGTGWTDHRRPSTVAPVAPPAPPTTPVPPAADDPNAFVAPGASLAGTAPVQPYAAPAYAAPAPAAPPYAAPGYAVPGQTAAGYAAPAYAPAEPTNGLAVVGLVIALGGLVLSMFGLTSLAGGIISSIALARASKMRKQGFAGNRWGMALAGTISGYALFVLIVAGYIVLFTLLANNSFGGSSTLS